MKLVRFGRQGAEKPGIMLATGQRKDLSSHFRDWNRDFFTSGGPAALIDVVEKKLEFLSDVPENERWGAPVARPGKIVCIGLNYMDHATEYGSPVPKEPVVFMKAPNTVIGPFDTILIPRGSVKTDWEVELGVVVGREARYLESVEKSADCIAGYCICNDVSERSFQMEHNGQWTKGKSCDTFCPVGPFVATPDEVADVRKLKMSLKVNGHKKQDSTTANMIFDVFFLVHYLSQFMTLEPGDLILTGTPAGVGFGHKPQEYLKPCDKVELKIEGLGCQRLVCRQA